MDRSRIIRFVIAGALVVAATISFVQGDLVTAILALLGTALGVMLAIGMRDEDQKAGLDWRTAAAWGGSMADAFMVVMLALVLVPVVLHAIE